MRVGLIISGGLAAGLLAGCNGEKAAGPKSQAPDGPVFEVVDQADGVIRVTGPAPTADSLDVHHCMAAQRARADGAFALEWLGGVAKRDEEGDGVTANLVYGLASEKDVKADEKKPAEGRAASVDDWLIYCDEAGIPREGEV